MSPQNQAAQRYNTISETDHSQALLETMPNMNKKTLINLKPSQESIKKAQSNVKVKSLLDLTD